MIHACYSTVRLYGVATANLTGNTKAPYVGAATCWILAPGATSPTPYTIACGADGSYEKQIYVDKPGEWKWCVRVGTDPHGGTFDKSFTVRETFAPETP